MGRSRGILSVACLALIGCEPKQQQSPEIPQLKGEYISASGELSSWGAPLERWRVDRDGRAQIIENEFGRSPSREVTKIFNLGPEQRSEFMALLGRLAAYQRRKLDCGPIGTDPPYLHVRFDTPLSSHVLNFEQGCVEPQAKVRQAAFDELMAFLKHASAGAATLERTIPTGRSTSIG